MVGRQKQCLQSIGKQINISLKKKELKHFTNARISTW